MDDRGLTPPACGWRRASAAGEDGGLAIQGDLENAGHDGIDPFPVLGLGGDDGAGRPGKGGYLVSAGFNLLTKPGFRDRAVTTGIPLNASATSTGSTTRSCRFAAS